MAYSFHLPLVFGLLKIKSSDRLRSEERDGRVPVWRLGDMYFVWKSARKKKPPSARPAEKSPS